MSTKSSIRERIPAQRIDAGHERKSSPLLLASICAVDAHIPEGLPIDQRNIPIDRQNIPEGPPIDLRTQL